jgi:hypothetical protein
MAFIVTESSQTLAVLHSNDRRHTNNVAPCTPHSTFVGATMALSISRCFETFVRPRHALRHTRQNVFPHLSTNVPSDCGGADMSTSCSTLSSPSPLAERFQFVKLSTHGHHETPWSRFRLWLASTVPIRPILAYRSLFFEDEGLVMHL